MAPPLARASGRRPRLTGVPVASRADVTRRRISTVVAVGLAAVALAGCADAEDDLAENADHVLPTATGSTDVSDATDSVVDRAVTDTGVSTTATADEEAVRENLAPGDDVVTRSPDAEGDGDPPQGVGTSIVRITDADGDVCEVCMWLADERDERSVGLMGVRDLGGPIGMAFTWDAPSDGSFYMYDTVTPLSIAWFAPDGSYLGETDMDPCLDTDASACELYGTSGPYTLAIEMFEGQLGKVGIGPGSTAAIVRVVDEATETICPSSS